MRCARALGTNALIIALVLFKLTTAAAAIIPRMMLTRPLMSPKMEIVTGVSVLRQTRAKHGYDDDAVVLHLRVAAHYVCYLQVD